jgi:ketosteroid isomerase-like protein
VTHRSRTVASGLLALAAACAVVAPRASSAADQAATPDKPGATATAVDDASVRAYLGAWRDAWQRQDVAPYLAFYATDATVDGRARDAFDAHKRAVFAHGGTVTVHLGDLEVAEVQQGGETLVRASFDQEYSSSTLSDFGRKVMLLRRKGGATARDAFVIVREDWTAGAGRIEHPLDGDVASSVPSVTTPIPKAPPLGTLPKSTPTAGTEPSAAVPVAGEDHPLLGGEYVPPSGEAAAPSGEPARPTDLLAPEPLLGQPFKAPTHDYGLPKDEGDRRVVEEVVARINGQILTRTMLLQRIAWYENTLVEQAPPDLEQRLAHLAADTLDATIDRWVLLQEARSSGADVEGFWRQWIAQFRKQVDATDMDDLEKILTEQGTSLTELKAQVTETEVPNVYLQQQVGAQITFTEDELKKHFAENLSVYEKPRSVTLRQILIPLDAGASPTRPLGIANAALAALREGKDWCDVHEIYSAPGPRCGDLGTMGISDLLPELREAAAGLPVGAVSQPVVSTQGVHILQVTERSAADEVKFEDARERVLADMRESEYQKRTKQFVADLRARAEIAIADRYAKLDKSSSGGVSQ